MLTTRPRLAPSRTAGLTDRYKRAWALHMKKYGRFGWYVDPVELEKRLKAARKHLSKWGCCRGSEWTDEELADQKLKAGKRGRKYLKLYGYGHGSKIAKSKLKRQKKELGNRCKKNNDAQVAARQATGAYPTTEHVGVSWHNGTGKWAASLHIRGVDGKKRTHVYCGTYALEDVNKAGEAVATKRTALGLPPAGEEVSDEVIRAATKMYEQTTRPACPKSGVTGVTWSNTENKWVARAARREFLGTFKDKEKAIAAVEARRKQKGLAPALDGRKKKRTAL